jgi:iron complex outermembrane recepter protein
MNSKNISVIFSILFIVFSQYVIAQSGKVKIAVYDDENISLPGAVVKITKQNNNFKITEMTDNNGIISINNIAYDIYNFNITYIGFSELDSLVKLTPEIKDYKFRLKSKSIALGEVSIVGKKPLIRQDGDKMVVDPAPIASIASNTLEVLESTPGLFVDQDGGIFISASSPATIYINGREQKMSSQDLTTILRSLPPSSIDKIEIMKTPSAKYDASSTGGIINIILKKGVKLGTFGSVNFGMNQGIYNRQSAGVSYNSGAGNTATYFNFNINNYRTQEKMNSLRNVNNDTSITQSSVYDSKNLPLVLSYGINFDFRKKSSFSFDGRINYTDRNSVSDNLNDILFSENIFSSSTNKYTSNSGFFNTQHDFGYKYKLDTASSELEIKLSHSYNKNISDQDFSIETLTPVLFKLSGNNSNDQLRNFYQFETNVNYNFTKNTKLEAGVKSTLQVFSSKSDNFYNDNGTMVPDSAKINDYKYLENINAGYSQISFRLFSFFDIKTGFRVENTIMNGDQTLPSKSEYNINRTDFFPYFYLSRKIFSMMGADLFAFAIYRKTISRPGYSELNPNIKLVDQFLIETGNPKLKPQFTDNYEVNISFNDMPVFAMGRNYTTDIFTSVNYPSDINENLIIKTFDNVGKNTETYFRGIVGIPPGNKYFFALGAQYNHNDYNGLYDGQPWTYSKGSWRFFTFHSLTIFKNTKINLMGFYMTPSQWSFYEISSLGQLNMGITQTLMNKKLTITLNARDILNTMKTDFTYNQGTIRSSGTRIPDTRWIGLNFRYSFGLDKKTDKKEFPNFENQEF